MNRMIDLTDRQVELYLSIKHNNDYDELKESLNKAYRLKCGVKERTITMEYSVEQIDEQIREEIRGYITNKTLKSEAVKKLRKKYNMTDRKIVNIWLEEKTNMVPRNRGGKRPTKPQIIEVMNNNIKINGLDRQLTLGIEKLSGLQQSICKYKLGENSNIESDIADVKILIDELEMIFSKAKIRKIKNKKLEELDAKLSENCSI